MFTRLLSLSSNRGLLCLALSCLLQLSSIGVPNEEQNRRTLRELLFTAPGVEDHISGVVSRGNAYTQLSNLLTCSIFYSR